MQHKYFLTLTFICLSQLLSCSSAPPQPQDGPPPQDLNITNIPSEIPNAIPKPEPRSRYGNPSSYTVNGHTYHVLKTAQGYDKKGIASWYGTKFNGQLTSTREPYNMFAMTAASTELPLPTYVRVTNLANSRQIVVKVNDRGPFDKNRVLDLSYVAAEKLGFAKHGTALIQVTAIDPSHLQQKIQLLPQQLEPQIYLQTGAFTNKNNAIKMRSQITALTKYQVYINKGMNHKVNKPIYRVQIGPLANVNENDHLQHLLTTQGLSAITVIK